MPGVIAGSILTFILSMNTYAIRVLLGCPKSKIMKPHVFWAFPTQQRAARRGAHVHPDDVDIGADRSREQNCTAAVRKELFSSSSVGSRSVTRGKPM
jgi:hypothetical protein